MNLKSMSLVIAALLVIFAIPVGAQDKLGDLLSEYGYDWMIGNWVATDDDGQRYELEYKWALDRCALIVDVKIGEFKYHGIIMFVPSRQEVIQIGADNMGNTWKGSWSEDYEGAVNRNEYLRPDGTIETIEHVHIKVDNDSFKVKAYTVEAGGYRASQPVSELTFKRRKAD
ncbi:MAG: hypothetical protein ACYTFW_16100 [Planctomycetota bacterium]|jgi:hypothetical protein